MYRTRRTHKMHSSTEIDTEATGLSFALMSLLNQSVIKITSDNQLFFSSWRSENRAKMISGGKVYLEGL